jgi:hypothetical protein
MYACRQDSNMSSMETPAPAPTTPGVAYHKINRQLAHPASPWNLQTEMKRLEQVSRLCLQAAHLTDCQLAHTLTAPAMRVFSLDLN